MTILTWLKAVTVFGGKTRWLVFLVAAVLVVASVGACDDGGGVPATDAPTPKVTMPPTPTAVPTAEPPTPPGSPMGLNASTDGRGRIEIWWSAPADDGGTEVTGYRIEVSEDGVSWRDLAADTGDEETDYVHAGLDVDTRLLYRVSAINAAGVGPASDAVGGMTTPVTVPEAPTGLTASTGEEERIDLSWAAPSEDGGAAITGYRIEVSEDGSDWRDLVTDTEDVVVTHFHIGLGADATRRYRVSAINSAGTGAASKVATGVTTPETVPGVTRELTATKDVERQIELSWSAPVDDGGAEITGYRVEVSLDGSDWSFLAADTGSADTRHSHTGLRAETSRHYRVSAINSAGVGIASDTAKGMTAPATVPSAPTELTATLGGERRIDLSWSAPADDGGSEVKGYRIEASGDSEKWSELEADTEGTDASYSHAGLRGGATHHYRVSAINSSGAGFASDVATGTTAPPKLPEAPTRLTASSDGVRRIELLWSAPPDDGGADITGYRIEASVDGEEWVEIDAVVRATGFFHTGLRGEDVRYYRVFAVNSVGASGASNVANGKTAPATTSEAPASLTASSGLERRIDLSWASPADDGGAHVVGYRIEASLDGVEWNVIASDTGSTEGAYSHVGLRGGAEQSYRVSAINSTGAGAASEVAVGMTAPATEPGAPTELTATTGWEKWIDLKWEAPSDDGGADITGYRIEISEDGKRWKTLIEDTGGSDTEYAHLGLEAGVTRHYRVSAVNSVGEGVESEVVTGATVLAGLAEDRAVLEAFYDATNGENWAKNTNWKTDLPLSKWHGVTMDSKVRVSGLSLQGNRLSGEIIPELGNLSNLKTLALTDNHLRGEIPRKLGGLSKLEILKLGDNLLSGEIPSELGNLTRLQRFSLDNNQLSGEIPPELGNLSSVIFFGLDYNQLSGSIPPEFGNFRRAVVLTLHENQLTGSIPKELGRLSGLRNLSLWGNRLTGEIPRELGNLSRLHNLSLGWNRLSGKIPGELGNLQNLLTLSLRNNRLTGSIPAELGSLAELSSLYLNHNQLEGEFPKELDDFIRMRYLRLGGNHKLAGCIPASLWKVENNDVPAVGLPSCDGQEYAKLYFSIQGTVTGPDGEPMEGVLIRAIDVATEDYGGIEISNYDFTGPDGSYLIRLPDETYYVFVGNDECDYVGAYGPGGYIKYTSEGSHVELDGADVTGIDIELPGDPNVMFVSRTGSCLWL